MSCRPQSPCMACPAPFLHLRPIIQPTDHVPSTDRPIRGAPRPSVRLFLQSGRLAAFMTGVPIGRHIPPRRPAMKPQTKRHNSNIQRRIQKSGTQSRQSMSAETSSMSFEGLKTRPAFQNLKERATFKQVSRPQILQAGQLGASFRDGVDVPARWVSGG